MKNFIFCAVKFLRFTDKIYFPANIYLFKVNNRNRRKKCEICSKLTNKGTRTMLLAKTAT